MNWIEDNGEARRELVKKISSDCTRLLDKIHLKYPHFIDLPPSQKVEDVLLDVCNFHVIDQPLPDGQLALCDFSCSTVFFNCDLPIEGDLQLFRTSTLAHELGHIVSCRQLCLT